MLSREMLTTTASGLGAELEKMYLDTFQSDYWLNGSEECTSLEQQSAGTVERRVFERDNPLGGLVRKEV